jgi:hypothetical protein
MTGKERFLALVTVLVLGLGVAPLLAHPLPYKNTDWLAYENMMYYGDPYEPNDTLIQAKSCPVDGAVQLQGFDTAGDQDWVWFSTTVGTAYVVETRAESLGSEADTVISLYDLNGNFLARADDSPLSSDALLHFRAAYTGTYYAQITEWTNSGGSDYWYYLQIHSLRSHYLPLVLK